MNKNRYLIIISYINHQTYSKNAGGMIIYFDDDNKIYSKIILNKYILSSYDDRNGYLRSNKFFFRNQILICLTSHRDNQRVLLYINEFNYDDQPINYTYVFTNMISSMFFQNILHNNKILTISNTCVIDMSSIIFDKIKKLITFDKYEFDSKCESIDKFLENFCGENYDSKYDDGYPLNCIKCNQKTNNIVSYYYGMMNMGSGFCTNCLIRYSQSEKRWKCSKIRNKNYCCKDLDSNYECNIKHDECEYKFDVKKSQKFPFKNYGSLEIKLKSITE